MNKYLSLVARIAGPGSAFPQLLLATSLALILRARKTRVHSRVDLQRPTERS